MSDEFKLSSDFAVPVNQDLVMNGNVSLSRSIECAGRALENQIDILKDLSAVRPIACGGTGAVDEWARYSSNPSLKAGAVELFHESDFTPRIGSVSESSKPKEDRALFFPSKIGRIDKLPRY